MTAKTIEIIGTCGHGLGEYQDGTRGVCARDRSTPHWLYTISDDEASSVGQAIAQADRMRCSLPDEMVQKHDKRHGPDESAYTPRSVLDRDTNP